MFRNFNLLIVFSVVVVVGAVLVFGLPSVSRASGWVYPGWQYRVLVAVQNQSGKTMNDYTVSLRIENQAHFFEHARSGGQDIRITDLNGNSLPFWIRRFEVSNQLAIINTRLLSLSPGENRVYVYYGNPGVSSVSDPHNTFDYYQDFSQFNPTVKFGVFADIHHDAYDNNYWAGPDFQQNKLGDARGRMQHLVGAMNNWNADFLINLGDFITAEDWPTGEWVSAQGPDFDPFTDCSRPVNPGDWGYCEGLNHGTCREIVECADHARLAMEQIEAEYAQFNNERYYVFDNHEFYSLGKQDMLDITGGQGAVGSQSGEWLEVNGQQKLYYSFIKSGIKFIIPDFQYIPGTNQHRGPEGESDYGVGYIPPDQLAWIEQELSSSNYPVVVFSSKRIEDHDFLNFDQCENYQQYNNYCTNPCNSPSDCSNVIAQCKDLHEYRRVHNGAEIRSVLENHSDKILAVFQGDHHSAYHYAQNGISYVSLKSSDQMLDEDVAYLKVEIDPVQRLLAVEGVGGTNDTNTFKISYANGKMHIDNSIKTSTNNFFLPVIIPYEQTWSDDVLIEAGWEFDPRSTNQQLMVGFWENMDWRQIRHRCASNGRTRRSNFAGARRVFANQGSNHFIGTQLNNEGNAQPSLDIANTATSGYFWVHKSGGLVRSWFNAGGMGGRIGTDMNLSGSPSLTPGIWVYDDVTGVSQASISNLIVRTAVYPEPQVVSVSEPEEYGGGLTYLELIEDFNRIGVGLVGDLNNDGVVNVFDLNLWVSN